ncbi:MAG: Nif3-like dinuclear metal center hexameric protein [Candidatus Nanohaloarchaea archaeon]|nr:Nif3-like dinuclear metal center hexameric protein [Candidatus Nanohaloarchaea archaeon]
MPTIQDIHEFAVEHGIKKDPRDREHIEDLLEERAEQYEELEGVRKERFDEDRLDNPYDDCKVLYGGDREVETVAVGIDIDAQELLLVDRLNEQGEDIDGVIAHHPQGRAYARLSDVMKLQIDSMKRAGIPVSQAEGIIQESAQKVRQGVHPKNHPRAPRAAELLDIPFMNTHTTTDNFAYAFMRDYLDEEDPRTLDDLIDALLDLEEYQWELGHGAGPEIFAGAGDNRVGEIGVLGFTGGTDAGDDIIDKMMESGIDTLVAMHATREQVEKAEEHSINIVTAGHMASDSLGINLLLDKLQDEFSVDVVELSGFKRVER